MHKYTEWTVDCPLWTMVRREPAAPDVITLHCPLSTVHSDGKKESDFRQSLVQVLNDILCVFDTDGQAYQLRCQACCLLLLFSQL